MIPIKKYKLIQGEIALQIEGNASRIYNTQNIDVCYYEDVEKFIKELEKELKVIEKKILTIKE